MRRRLLMAMPIAFLPMLLIGCFGGSTSQVVAIDAPSMRANFNVIDESTEKIIVKGVTPDTILLNRKGRYRVEITHPKTGKVHSTIINGVLTGIIFSGNARTLSPSSVTAEFSN